MITPEVRFFHSPDVEDLEGYRPTDPGNFSLLLQIMVGPSGEEGHEAFDVQLATPQWLEERNAGDGFASGENRVVIFNYDWPRLEAYFRTRIAACAGQDWGEVAGKISRFARWEFEDYQA